MMTLNEAAKLLGVTRRKLNRLRRLGVFIALELDGGSYISHRECELLREWVTP